MAQSKEGHLWRARLLRLKLIPNLRNSLYTEQDLDLIPKRFGMLILQLSTLSSSKLILMLVWDLIDACSLVNETNMLCLAQTPGTS